MRAIALSRGLSFVLAIAALLGGCGDSASSVDALEGVAPPAGQAGERLMAEAELAAANAAERNPGAATVPALPSGAAPSALPAN